MLLYQYACNFNESIYIQSKDFKTKFTQLTENKTIKDLQVRALLIHIPISLTLTNLFKVVGYQEGMALMEQADPLVLLVGLPTIPIFLILGKMVRWEDKVLRLIRMSVQRLPFLKYLLPAFRQVIFVVFCIFNTCLCDARLVECYWKLWEIMKYCFLCIEEVLQLYLVR